jgi:hypothetical protein
MMTDVIGRISDQPAKRPDELNRARHINEAAAAA